MITAFTRNRIPSNAPFNSTRDLGNYDIERIGDIDDYSVLLLLRPGFMPVVLTVDSSKPDDPPLVELRLSEVAGRSRAEYLVYKSYSRPDLRGRGLGLRTYEAALHHFGSLSSSADLSVGSAMVWKKLVEKYDGCLAVFSNGKLTEVPITGWVQKSSFWWPLLGEKRVPLPDLMKRGDMSESAEAARSALYYIERTH